MFLSSINNDAEKEMNKPFKQVQGRGGTALSLRKHAQGNAIFTVHSFIDILKTT